MASREPIKASAGGRRRLSARARRRSVTTAPDLSSVYFAPLAGTGEEARAIKRLFPEATLLTGQHATKAALERIDGPGILHIATHGFFLEERAPARTPAGTAPAAAPPTHRAATSNLENPLLRSGLALAGANLGERAGTTMASSRRSRRRA